MGSIAVASNLLLAFRTKVSMRVGKLTPILDDHRDAEIGVPRTSETEGANGSYHERCRRPIKPAPHAQLEPAGGVQQDAGMFGVASGRIGRPGEGNFSGHDIGPAPSHAITRAMPLAHYAALVELVERVRRLECQRASDRPARFLLPVRDKGDPILSLE